MAPPNHKTFWTKEEDRKLAWRWAQVDIHRIAQHHGRTEIALAYRARILGLPPAGQWAFSLRAVADHLGYDPIVILALAKRLELSLHRQPRTIPGRRRGDGKVRFFAITEDQVDELTAELDRLGWPEKPNLVKVEGVWGTGGKPLTCRGCNCTDRPHVSRGLCDRCRHRCRKDGSLYRYAPIRNQNKPEAS